MRLIRLRTTAFPIFLLTESRCESLAVLLYLIGIQQTDDLHLIFRFENRLEFIILLYTMFFFISIDTPVFHQRKFTIIRKRPLNDQWSTQIILFFLYDDELLALYVRSLCSYGCGNHVLCCAYVYLVGKFFSLYDTSLRNIC